MRVGFAGFLHESNTFADEKTDLRHFEEAFYHKGPALVPIWRDAHHELGGFIEGVEATSMELVPLLAASATPKGTVTKEAYERVIGELLDSIRAEGPLDGLLLALHGAMVTEHLDSADSETVRRIRSVIGDDIPLILSLDMHANIAPPMVQLPDATIAYRTYPHIDQRERGVECAQLMARTLRGEVVPVQASVKLPLLIHIVRQYTGDGAMSMIMEAADEAAARPGILSVSIAPGYIYADVPCMGASVVVVADGDHDLAQREARAFAKRVYDMRHELNAALPDVEEAVRQAATIRGTVCLMDSGDNIGGGGPGDSTHIFKKIRAQGVPNACVILYDPEGAARCGQAGEGFEVSLRAGSETIEVGGVVKTIHDGKFVEPEPRHGGVRDFDQGLTAVIETHDGHTVVLNSLRVMPTSIEQLRSLGIQPEGMNIIIVKGVTAPRAAYDAVATATIPVDSPGVTQAGPDAFAYTRRPKPLFPLEDPGEWTPGS